LAETNPYIVNDARIQNTECFNSFSLGTELEISRAVKAKASINYKRAWNHPIFVDISNAHVWSVAYFGTTRIMSFESELYADITTDDHLGATFAIRNNQNFDTNNELPYFPQVVLGALYQHRFPFKLSLMSNLRYIDRQYADVANTRSVSSFLLWDARAVYEIIQRLSVGLAVENILDQQQHWWENYVGQPRRAMLSVGFTW
jgi:outer membrane receptor protein involved in Fe transport